MADDFDGWGNSATQGYALVLFNDRKLFEQLDEGIQKGLCRSYHEMVGQIPRGNWWEGDVDMTSIILHRAEELRDEERITATRYERLFRHVTNKDNRYGHYWLGKNPASTNDSKNNADTANKTEGTQMSDAHIETMSTIHFINGKDVAHMSVDQKVSVIAATEKRIKELEQIETPSKMIAKELKKIKSNLTAATALFDAESE